MRRSTIYGAALVAGALGMTVTMFFHPTAHDLLAPSGGAARRGEAMAAATHALALASAPTLFFGFLGLSRRLGPDRPLVSAALVAFAFGAVAAMTAAIVSGLVAPALTRQMLAGDDANREALHRIFRYNGLLNQGFAKVYVVASSLAVLCWSAAVYGFGRLARLVAAFGCAVALLSLSAFFAGRLRLDAHGFGLFVFAQSAWVVLVGVFVLRRGQSREPAREEGRSP
ncbi:MAG TPA: hypothetical protein VN228_07130 [Pyrinomonadaceae bacterium]|nr:hypothetical protein [Pyrinomonadaceae bacterium]